VDPVILAGMVFSIIVLLMIGGFVLLLPLSQRLGKLLDLWITEQKRLRGSGSVDEERTHQVLADMSARLRALEEQQVFLEELVGRKDALPRPGEENV
jgi:hypothetical protein